MGEAGDGGEALRLIREKKPDVAVLDLSMPVMNGIEVIGEARDMDTAFIILTMHSDIQRINTAFKSGAKGYLLKEGAFNELVEAIREVDGGKEFVSPAILEQLAEVGVNLPFNKRPDEDLLPKPDLHPILARVRGWIDKNMSSSFTLVDAARANATSVSHLSRLYKDHLGISFTDDVNRMRVERAKRLLRTTDDPVDLIWEAAGYESPQSFFRNFKKIAGITPREYRLSHLKS